ncbi:glycosyltransferase family 4 protein [Cnuibacter physcomitrellae]|uniref:glycosyltransferase family 4 protein n=1 Tax=Cnuibacter physcomitrellae TaxID=1619308 RepID=UPI0035C67571
MAHDELANSGSWLEEPELSGGYVEENAVRELSASGEVLCASTFTKRSLVLDGFPPELVRVVPYGCPPPSGDPSLPRERRFLFVGQGVQRKGLHVLLEAWRRAGLAGSTLRVIASRLDPTIARLAQGLEGVIISGSLPREELEQEMQLADTLVLPSLVEGFGLVIGEALAAGCRVIASQNTGAIDLALPGTVMTPVRAGSVDSLVEAIQENSESYARVAPYRLQAQEAALANGWDRFRADVRSALGIEAVPNAHA